MKTVNVIVKKRFLDKYNGVFHEVGEKLTVTSARYREINRKDKFVEVETAKNEKAPEKAAEIKK